MKLFGLSRLAFSALTLSVLGCLPLAAFAQVTVDINPDDNEDVVEEIVVVGTGTGTSIRGIDPIGYAPIDYTRADIETDSPVDVRDALSNVPQISNFNTDADRSTSNRFRTAGYQPIIHNLGIYSTLTLFNGHRMADVGGEAVFPDPAILPTIAVERVEVVADGASAIYGSDAVAGVVNFLYRRGVDGFEFSSTVGTDPDTTWQNRNVALLWGNTFDRGEVMLAYEYSKLDRPTQEEFWFSADADHSDIPGGSDSRTSNCPWVRVNFGGDTYSGPDLTPGTTRCNPNGDQSIAQNGERNAALATFHYDVSDTVELWAEANFSDYQSYRINNWGNGGRFQIDIPSTSPSFTVPPGADPTGVDSENVRGIVDAWFGLRRREADSEVKGITLGANFEMGGGWLTQTFWHYSKTNDWNYDPGADLQNLQALAASGDFNPFDLTGNSQSVLDQINNGFVQLNDTSQKLSELSVKADGPIASIAGGDVMLAIGASHRIQGAQQLQSAGCPSCSFYQIVRDDNIARGVDSVFAELAIPLIGPGNARAGARELTLSLAGRFDDYDRLDAQFNPKVGFTWRPIEDLSIHGTWGTSFVAPNMGLITAIFGVPQTGIRDSGLTLPNPDTNYDFDIWNKGGGGGYDTLGPEEADSYSFGFTWQPQFADGLSVGVTYYEVEYRDNVYKPTRGDVLDNPAFSDHVGFGEYDPVNDVFLPFTDEELAELMRLAPSQTPVVPGQTFNMWFDSYAINFGSRTHAGYDYNIRYDFDTSVGRWGLSAIANKQTTFDEKLGAGVATFSRIGTGDAPGWQTRFMTQWAGNELPLRATLVSMYKSGYTDGSRVVDSHLFHNLTLAYDIDSLLNGVTLQLRVRNLTDEEPPFYDSGSGYDDDNHTPYGRQFDLTLRASF